MADGREGQERDELAESLNDLFTNLSSMVKSELQLWSGSLLRDYVNRRAFSVLGS